MATTTLPAAAPTMTPIGGVVESELELVEWFDWLPVKSVPVPFVAVVWGLESVGFEFDASTVILPESPGNIADPVAEALDSFSRSLGFQSSFMAGAE